MGDVPDQSELMTFQPTRYPIAFPCHCCIYHTGWAGCTTIVHGVKGQYLRKHIQVQEETTVGHCQLLAVNEGTGHSLELGLISDSGQRPQLV